MAITSVYFTARNPVVGQTLAGVDVDASALENSAVIELKYDDAVFTASLNEGKQRLLLALEALKHAVESETWPIA